MSDPEPRILLLTGRPGVGKTTVVRRVVDRLERPVAGFYTEEIREGGSRTGFRLVPFDGRERVMAHVDREGEPRVSRYGVDLAAVDEAVGRLPDPPARGADAPPGGKIDAERGEGRSREEAGPPPSLLYVVDEIGKMECFSDRFVETMRSILDSRAPLLATVARRGRGFIAEVKEHPEARVREVTRRNRDRMPARVLEWLGEPDPERSP